MMNAITRIASVGVTIVGMLVFAALCMLVTPWFWLAVIAYILATNL